MQNVCWEKLFESCCEGQALRKVYSILPWRSVQLQFLESHLRRMMTLKTSSFELLVALPCVHSRCDEADVKCEVPSSIKGLSFHDTCQMPSVSSMNICTAISCRPSTIEIVSFIKEHCLGSIKDHPLNDISVAKIMLATLIQDTCTLASRMISAATSFKNHSLTRGLLKFQ